MNTLIRAGRPGLEPLERRVLLDGGMGHGGSHPLMAAENKQLLDLVPLSAVTDTAARSGNWSDPATWQRGVVPGANANVHIPEGVAVTFDVALTAPLRTIRDDGKLMFSAALDTRLVVDTLAVTQTGELEIGTKDAPIPAGVRATVVFADGGRIDTRADPYQLGRGLISIGMTSIYGSAVTSSVSLAEAPHKGASTLVLSQAPLDWKVGDQLVLTGTNPTQNQDEQLTVLAVAGNRVTVRPLAFDHTPPPGQSVYVASLTRNVNLRSENTTDPARRGHVMFMHTDQVTVGNAGFYDLGRTDKSKPIDDPQFDAMGKLIAGTGLNRRARYALHFHFGGTDHDMPAIPVTGSVVVGSPGWGFVNHSSHVEFADNVAFNVRGAAFVTEAGDEIGAFRGNLAIRTTGVNGNRESGDNMRINQQDFGYAGHGFWFQGPGAAVVGNVSAGHADAGFFFFTKGLVVGGKAVQFEGMPVGTVPLQEFAGNVAFAGWHGLDVWHQLEQADAGTRATVEGFTAWNVLNAGVRVYKSDNVTLRNVTVIGNAGPSVTTAIGVLSDGTGGIVYDGLRVENTQVGIYAPSRGANTIKASYLNSLTGVRVPLSAQPVTVRVADDVTFGRLSPELLRGGTQKAVSVEVPTLKSSELPAYFGFAATVLFRGKQVYAAEQGRGYVPFPAGRTPAFVPAALVGLTNQQLSDRYGLAVGGAVAPADAAADPRVAGLLGSPMAVPAKPRLLSPTIVYQTAGYQLVYQDAGGRRVEDPQRETLKPGWNLITRTIGGRPESFLVFANTAPTFTADAAALVINPLDVTKKITVGGTVTDPMGSYRITLNLSGLAALPQLRRADGSIYVRVPTYYWHRGSVRVDLVLELTLDPNAPQR